MKYVRIVGSVRGFFSHLLEIDDKQIKFIANEKNMYEISFRYKRVLAFLLRTRIVGFWGLFKVNKVKEIDKKADCYLSFNRFLDCDKEYYIYLENPTALCNYSITALHSPFIKRKLQKQIDNPRLKQIICMSKACESTVEEVLGIHIPSSKITQIYPYVPTNNYVNEENINKRSRGVLKLLYIAQGPRFYSKGGMEVFYVYKRLREKYNIELTIITNTSFLNSREIDDMRNTMGLTLLEFNLPFEKMEKIYASCNILLQPSSDDSFGLTILEAMKAGLAVISSNMYAFPEMVIDGVNGYTVEPAWHFYDKYNTPNAAVWNRRRSTIYSKKKCHRLIQDLYDKIESLEINRDLLNKMQKESYTRANNQFGEKEIIKKWEKSIL